MAGKTTESLTLFAQKKLLGKAHTSNLKLDSNESIPSFIAQSNSTVFGEPIPDNPTKTLGSPQGVGSNPGTVEYVTFELIEVDGSSYDANDPGGGSGTDSGESGQSSGAHAYAFKLSSTYESDSSNTKAGTGNFVNGKHLSGTLGKLQIVPDSFSLQSNNPYTIEIYKNTPFISANKIGAASNIDWQLDTSNGILFVQDYDASEIPLYARGFIYVGEFADQGNFYNGLSGSLQNLVDGSSYLVAGDNITITTASNGQITIASTATGGGGGGGSRSKKSYNITSLITSGSVFSTSTVNYNDANHNPELIDVFLNGQLLLSGTDSEVGSGDVDYFVHSNNELKFGFDLQIDDIVNVIVTTTGSSGDSGGSGDTGASYLVLGSTGSLSNERAFVAGTGLTADDGGANGNYTLSIDDSVVPTLTSSAIFSNGISGSLTQLSDGTSYIIGGGNVTVSSASNGAITISSFVPERNKEIYEVNSNLASGSAFTTTNSNFGNAGFKTNLIDIYLNGQLLMSGTDSQVGAGSVDYFVSSYNEVKFGFDLKSEDVVNIMITPTGSSGGSGGSGGSGTEYTAGTGLILNGTEFSIDDSVVTTLTSSATFTNGLSGSLTQLSDGSSYLIAGSNVTITSASNGSVTIASTGGGTSYTAGTGIILDGTEFSIDDSIVATLTSSAQFSNGLSGSLTQLTDGTSYLIAGSNVSIASASNGSVTISATDNNTTYTAGTGLDLTSTEFSVDDSIVATLSGSQFSGNVGITGSLGIESQTIFNAGIHEKFTTKTSATGVVVHDCSSGHIFYHTSLSSDFTANFTNLGLLSTYGTNITLVLVQGATARIPTAVQIGGVSQTLLWQGGSAPSGTNNGTDVVSFSILNNAGTYTVLGQLVGFS